MSRSRPKSIRHRGRQLPVLDEVRLRGRPYWVVAQLGRAGRSRQKVYDPAGRTLRTVHQLPDSADARQQVEALRRLDRAGACVPGLLDAEHVSDGWRLLTTWVEGQSLANYLAAARDGGKPWPSAYLTAKLFTQLVHGLCQFHQFTMGVHGDVSPANIILQAQPQRLVLIDYGSTWQEERIANRAPGDGASVGYAAPEVARGESAGQAADQFSATVLFYEMLTGELPYEGMGGRAALAAHGDAYRDAYFPPSQLAIGRQELPQSVWGAIDRLAETGLRLDASERFANGSSWREAASAVRRAIEEPLRRSAFGRLGAAVAEYLADRMERAGSKKR